MKKDILSMIALMVFSASCQQEAAINEKTGEIKQISKKSSFRNEARPLISITIPDEFLKKNKFDQLKANNDLMQIYEKSGLPRTNEVIYKWTELKPKVDEFLGSNEKSEYLSFFEQYCYQAMLINTDLLEQNEQLDLANTYFENLLKNGFSSPKTNYYILDKLSKSLNKKDILKLAKIAMKNYDYIQERGNIRNKSISSDKSLNSPYASSSQATEIDKMMNEILIEEKHYYDLLKQIN